MLQFKSQETYILLLHSRDEWKKQVKTASGWMPDPSGAKIWKTKYLFTDALTRSKQISFLVAEPEIRFAEFKDKPVYLLVSVREFGGKIEPPKLEGLEIAKK